MRCNTPEKKKTCLALKTSCYVREVCVVCLVIGPSNEGGHLSALTKAGQAVRLVTADVMVCVTVTR